MSPKAGRSAGHRSGQAEAGAGRARVTAGAPRPAGHATPLTIFCGGRDLLREHGRPSEREEAAQQDAQSCDQERHCRADPLGGQAQSSRAGRAEHPPLQAAYFLPPPECLGP